MSLTPEQIEKVRAEFEVTQPFTKRNLDGTYESEYREMAWRGYLARAEQDHAERQALEAENRAFRAALQNAQDRIATLEARIKAMESGESSECRKLLDYAIGLLAGADPSPNSFYYAQRASELKHKASLLTPPAQPAAVQVPDVETMVNRFLGWKLPHQFNPDAGISFNRNLHKAWGGYPNSWPVGTNLLDANQAREMVLHMLAAPQPAQEVKANG